MRLRSILLLVVVGVIALFAALNWEAFTAPTTLRLGFGTMEAPLGLIMLGVTVLLTLLFLVFVTYLQASVSNPKPRVTASCVNFLRRNYNGFRTRASNGRLRF